MEEKENVVKFLIREKYGKQLKWYSDSITQANSKYFRELDILHSNCLQAEEYELALKAICTKAKAYAFQNNLDEAKLHFEMARNMVKNLPSENLEAVLFNQLGTFYWNTSQHEAAIDYFNQSLQLYINFNDMVNIALVSQNLGVAYYKISDFKKAFEYLNYAYINRNIIEDPISKGNICTWFGILHKDIGILDRAFDLINESNEIFLSQKHFLGYANNQNTLGLIYNQINNLENALKCFIEAEKYAIDLSIPMILADALNNKGMVYNELCDYPHAIECYLKSLEVRKSTGTEDKEINTLNNLALACISNNDLETAELYVQQAISGSQHIGILSCEFISYNSAANLYLEKGDLKKTEYYAHLMMQKAVETNSDNYLKGSHAFWKELYKKKKKYKMAHKHAVLELEYEEKIFNYDLKRKLADAHFKNEILNAKNHFEEKVIQEKTDTVLNMALRAYNEINSPIQLFSECFSNFEAYLNLTSLTTRQVSQLSKIKSGIDKIKSILESYKFNNEFTFTDYAEGYLMVDFPKKSNQP